MRETFPRPIVTLRSMLHNLQRVAADAPDSTPVPFQLEEDMLAIMARIMARRGQAWLQLNNPYWESLHLTTEGMRTRFSSGFRNQRGTAAISWRWCR
jgi:hypothetical protein